MHKIKRADGKVFTFKYDAFGRRISKSYHRREFLYIWDKNVPLHEIQKEELCEDNIITWIFEGFTPTAKLINGKAYSIISDHIGTPLMAIDTQGNKVWERELDIYGKVRKEFTSDDVANRRCGFMPFLYAGQYYDKETDLAYNRFRYYDPNSGNYISQDPIGLDGGLAFYAYVHDVNGWVDVFGLDLHHIIPQSVWKSINKNYDNVLKNIDGYVQNVSKKAKDISNLIDLDKPFHGNHPKYNEYVNERIKDLIKNNDLNLKSIKELQEELVNHINDAMKSGKTLNDYFKEGLHKICK